MKRGQTATEYLILLSVILVITLIAVSSLVDFPSLIGSVDRQSDSAYWQYSDVRIMSHAQNSTHLLMDVQNALYEPINITKIHVNSQEFNTSYYLQSGERVGVILNYTSDLDPGDEYSHTIDFEFIQGSTNITYPGLVPIGGIMSDN